MIYLRSLIIIIYLTAQTIIILCSQSKSPVCWLMHGRPHCRAIHPNQLWVIDCMSAVVHFVDSMHILSRFCSCKYKCWGILLSSISSSFFRLIFFIHLLCTAHFVSRVCPLTPLYINIYSHLCIAMGFREYSILLTANSS